MVGACLRLTCWTRTPQQTLRSGAEDQARVIVETLASFGVDATVTQINEGSGDHTVRRRAGLGSQNARGTGQGCVGCGRAR